MVGIRWYRIVFVVLLLVGLSGRSCVCCVLVGLSGQSCGFFCVGWIVEGQTANRERQVRFQDVRASL